MTPLCKDCKHYTPRRWWELLYPEHLHKGCNHPDAVNPATGAPAFHDLERSYGCGRQGKRFEAKT
jgi:hypothetical protein